MMLTLLGSLLGFLSSTFPEFLKLFAAARIASTNSPSSTGKWGNSGLATVSSWRKSRLPLTSPRASRCTATSWGAVG